MIEKLSMAEYPPITFKKLGRTLPKLPKKKPKKRIRIGDFAQFGYCPYTAWHLAKRTTPIFVPKVKEAQIAGKNIHNQLDVKHEEKMAELPKATEKTMQDRYKPLMFPRNLPVYLYHKPFLYVGLIDNACREKDGDIHIIEDKTTKRIMYWPWKDNLLQVKAYCAGMANTYWRKFDARYLRWHIRYRDRSSGEHLNDFEGMYGSTSHEDLFESLGVFEAIYQGEDISVEVNPKRCVVCKYANGCSFKA